MNSSNHKHRKLMLWITILILTASVLARGDESKELEKWIDKINAGAKSSEDTELTTDVISDALGIKQEALKKANSATGLSWGELLAAHYIAKAGSKDLEKIISDRKSGKGFAEIATASNVKLSQLIKDVKRIQKSIQQQKAAELADSSALEQWMEEVDALASSAAGDAQVAGIISSDSGVSEDDLKKEKSQTGLTWGQIAAVQALAKATGKSFDQIISELKAGKRLTDIARESNLRLNQITKEMKQADLRVSQERENRAPTARRDSSMANRNSSSRSVSRVSGPSQGRSRR